MDTNGELVEVEDIDLSCFESDLSIDDVKILKDAGIHSLNRLMVCSIQDLMRIAAFSDAKVKAIKIAAKRTCSSMKLDAMVFAGEKIHSYTKSALETDESNSKPMYMGIAYCLGANPAALMMELKEKLKILQMGMVIEILQMGMVTKKDIQALVTKAEIKDLIGKADIRILATKEDTQSLYRLIQNKWSSMGKCGNSVATSVSQILTNSMKQTVKQVVSSDLKSLKMKVESCNEMAKDILTNLEQGVLVWPSGAMCSKICYSENGKSGI